jgi:pimeloyl-ACP methyl ester carboxylesterase
MKSEAGQEGGDLNSAGPVRSPARGRCACRRPKGRANLSPHGWFIRSIELFERFGGPEIGELARYIFKDGFTRENMLEWVAKAMPLYSRRAKPDPDLRKRSVMNPEVFLHFAGPDGEGRRFNMLSDLGKIKCPTLVLGGEDDPMTPIEAQEDIVKALPQHLVRFERFAGCGHGVFREDPRALDVVREFISGRNR